jgi:pantoate--beta-alanine ligase
VVCPVLRDPDGLAVSAANMGLSIEERHAATCLYAAIAAAEAAYDAGERSAEVLRARMTERIGAEQLARIDYVSVADGESLAELSRLNGPALAMVAVWIGRTRLTDSVPLG